MRNLFPGYSRLSDSDFKKLWNDCIFVLDTNVLLNVYRYQTTTSREFLSTLSLIKERIWIPYHVMLEFYRNRPTVILEQGEKFSQVKKIISELPSNLRNQLDKLQLEKKHSLIDPNPLINEVEQVAAKHLNELEKLEESGLKLSSIDPILEELERICTNRVGKAPDSADEIIQIQEQAADRYNHRVPPGYKDIGKVSESSKGSFVYGEISYERMYGDFIIWDSMLKTASKENWKALIFITDETKIDWWWKESGQTIGPRPELVEEMRRIGGIELYHQYDTHQFLIYANIHLQAQVSEDSIEDIQAVNQSSKTSEWFENESYSGIIHTARLATEYWIRDAFNVSYASPPNNEPDYIATMSGLKVGFYVVVIRFDEFARTLVKKGLQEAEKQLGRQNLDYCNTVFVCSDTQKIQLAIEAFEEIEHILLPSIGAIFGVLEFDYRTGVPKYWPSRSYLTTGS